MTWSRQRFSTVYITTVVLTKTVWHYFKCQGVSLLSVLYFFNTTWGATTAEGEIQKDYIKWLGFIVFCHIGPYSEVKSQDMACLIMYLLSGWCFTICSKISCSNISLNRIFLNWLINFRFYYFTVWHLNWLYPDFISNMKIISTYVMNVVKCRYFLGGDQWKVPALSTPTGVR